MLLLSLLNATAALAHHACSGRCGGPVGAGSVAAAQLLPWGYLSILGPATALLSLLLLDPLLRCGQTHWRVQGGRVVEATKFAIKLLALLLRSSMPAPAPARAVWLLGTLPSALTCKLRLQWQLLLSASALLLTTAAAAAGLLDPEGSSKGGAGALGGALAAAVLHCGIVYAWDARLRAAFLNARRGSCDLKAKHA
jgi:hypothetical protein